MDEEKVSADEQCPVESTDDAQDSCSDSSSQLSKEEDPKSSAGEEWTELDKDGWENILGSGRLRRKIITPAASVQQVRPTKGDYVKVSLKGTFEDRIFEENPAYQFNCEEGEAIRALDLVIALMHLGETDEFIADPELAYGDFGFPPHLPSKGAAHFEVTLLEHRPALASTLDLQVEERKAVGLRKKERGNFWFSRSEYSMAVQCYRKAVEYFEDEGIQMEVPMDRYTLPEPLQDLVTEKIKAYNNLAQAQLKLEAYESALASLKNVLKLDPNNEKALFRKAKALAEQGDNEQAIGTLRRVTRLYKDNKLAQAELQRLLGRQVQYNQKAKTMSKKMLGLDKYEEEMAKAADAKKWRFNQTLLLGAMMGGLGAVLGGAYAWLNAN